MIIKMKKFIAFIVCSVILAQKSYSQVDSLETMLLCNDSIHYDIALVTTFNPRDPNQLNGRFVDIRMKKTVRKLLLSKDSAFWISHLENARSDWATNLILYCLYYRDAAELAYIYTDRAKWIKRKPDEIEYWKKFLATHNRKTTEKKS